MRKNLFSQLAAVSLIPNAVVDMVPLNPQANGAIESAHNIIQKSNTKGIIVNWKWKRLKRLSNH